MNRKKIFQLIFVIAFVVLVGKVKDCYAIPNPDWFHGANSDYAVYCELGANFRVDATAQGFNSISVSDTADHSIATVDLKSEGAYAYQLPVSCSESDNCATVHVNCKSVGSTTFDISGVGTNDNANSSKTKRISIVVVEDPEGDMTKEVASFVTPVSNGSSSDLGDTIDEECIVGSKIYKNFVFNRTSLWNGEWQSNQDRVSSSNSSIASVTLGDSLSTTDGWIEVDCKSVGTSQITVGSFITAIKTAGYYSRAGEYESLAGLAPNGRVYTSDLKMNVTVRENTAVFSVTPEEITISVGETSGVSATQTGTVQVNTFPTYYSSNPQVATVDNRTGEVTGVSEGEATITAKYGSIVAGTTHVTVTGSVGFSVTPKTLKISVGENSTISATQTGTTQVNTLPTFVSSNPQVAKVDSRTGVVTGVSGGETIITVKYGSIVAGTVRVTVIDSSDFSIDTFDLIITIGEKSTVTAMQRGYLQVNTLPTYESSNPDVVKVDEHTGEITGVSVGEATIRARYGSIIAGETHVEVVGGVEIEVPDTTMDLSITQIIIGIILTLIGLCTIFYFEHRKKNS